MSKLLIKLFLTLFFINIPILLLASEQKGLDEGKKLFQTHCASCHGAAGGMDMSKRIAPPIFAVKRHYIGSYPDEMTFVMAIADWVETRNVENTLMPGAIRRFKVMPAIAIEREQVEKIAAYIFADKKNTPANYEHHYRQQHGLH